MSNSSILMVGNGRVALHLSEYLSLLGIPFSVWHRQQQEAFEEVLGLHDCVLLAISDQSLGQFIELHRAKLETKRVIHFSGALYFEEAIGAHPLMTFATTTYSLDLYKKIPFAIDRPQLCLSSLIEGLYNPSFYVPREKKAVYHALCSFSGNLTQLLWIFARKEFEQELSVSSDFLNPYLEQVFQNLLHLQNPLTGPLVRNDFEMVKLHQEVLPKALSEIYQSFTRAYLSKESENEPRSL